MKVIDQLLATRLCRSCADDIASRQVGSTRGSMTMAVKFIDLAEHSTRFLGGRYIREGPNSGEEFREKVLLPALRDHDEVVVNFDNVIGFTWSFLDEAFGGAVWALDGLNKLTARLTIVADDTVEWKDRVLTYMQEAEDARVEAKTSGVAC